MSMYETAYSTSFRKMPKLSPVPIDASTLFAPVRIQIIVNSWRCVYSILLQAYRLAVYVSLSRCHRVIT